MISIGKSPALIIMSNMSSDLRYIYIDIHIINVKKKSNCDEDCQLNLPQDSAKPALYKLIS